MYPSIQSQIYHQAQVSASLLNQSLLNAQSIYTLLTPSSHPHPPIHPQNGHNEVKTSNDSNELTENNVSQSNQVSDFLSRLGLERYIAAFDENEFKSIEELKQITNEDLKELGVAAMAHRKKILHFVTRATAPDRDRKSSARRSCFDEIQSILDDLNDDDRTKAIAVRMKQARDEPDYENRATAARKMCEALCDYFTLSNGNLEQQMGIVKHDRYASMSNGTLKQQIDNLTPSFPIKPLLHYLRMIGNKGSHHGQETSNEYKLNHTRDIMSSIILIGLWFKCERKMNELKEEMKTTGTYTTECGDAKNHIATQLGSHKLGRHAIYHHDDNWEATNETMGTRRGRGHRGRVFARGRRARGGRGRGPGRDTMMYPHDRYNP